MNQVTALEIQNAAKVFPMLIDIPGLKVEQSREDIFVVTECATGNGLAIIVDVEPTTVCLMMEIMDVPADAEAEFFQYLLELNAQAVHGKFSITSGKIVLRENLQIQNLDPNEIEKALEHMFLVAAKNFKQILKFGGIEVDDSDFEYDDESDLDEINLEDLVDAGMTVASAIAETGDEEDTEETDGVQFEEPDSVGHVVEDSSGLAIETEEPVREEPAYTPPPPPPAPEPEPTSSFGSSDSSDSYGGGSDSGSSDFGGGSDD